MDQGMNSLIKQEKIMNELTTYNAPLWQNELTDTADFVLPKITIMQASSKLVSAGSALPGEIIDGSDIAVLAKKNETLEIIPIKAHIEWVKKVKISEGKFDYIGKVPFVAGAIAGKWTHECIEDGKPMKYSKQLNLYCLLPKYPERMPYVATFKGMSVFTAKKMISHFMYCSATQKSPADFVFNLSTSLKSFNDISSFAYESVKSPRGTTPEEKDSATKWREVLNNTTVAIADEVEVDEMPFQG